MRNIKSYIFQFISILLSFLNVRLFLDFLGDDGYSTWLVIFSIAGLIYALDLGIGSSVRNQLARLMARNITSKAQARLVITYYKLILVFALGFGLVATGAAFLTQTFGWLEVLSIQSLVVLTILIFSDFVTRAHHPVFAGLQRPHLTNFALAGIQLCIFLAMQFALIPNEGRIAGKLMAIASVVFGASILINAAMILCLNHVLPIFSVVSSAKALGIRLGHVAAHLKRGLPFFVLQIEFAILGQIALYFIYSNFADEVVVEMAIAEKVFAPFIIIATIIMYPFWSGYTLLMHRGEADVVRKLLRRQECIAVICLPFLCLSIVFYNDIIQLWLNRKTETTIFAFFAALKVFTIFFNSIYSYFMNGAGKLRPQLYAYSIGLLVALPALYFASMRESIYLCLLVTPMVFLMSAVVQRHFVFNRILTKQGQGGAG